MISLNFYKNVPFSPENNDVILDVQNSFETYLEDFFSFNAVLDDWFDIIGSEEAGQIDVSFDNNENINPDELNYCSVFYYDTNENVIRKKYFFVTNFQHLSEKTYRMFLTIDYWQSYFIRRGATSENGIEIPEIKNALVVQGHVTGDVTSYSSIKPDLTIGTPTITHVFGDSYRVVFHGTTADINNPECVFCSNAVYGKDDACAIVNEIMNKSSITISGRDVGLEVLNVYIIPIELLSNFNSTDFQQANFNNTFFYSILNGGGGINYKHFYKDEFYYYVHFTSGRKKQIVSSFINLDLDIELSEIMKIPNSDLYSIHSPIQVLKFILTAQNDLSIMMIVNGQIIDIIQNFECSSGFNENSYYNSIHKNSTAINGITHMIGLGLSTGSAVAGNPASILGIIKSVENIGQFVANINDRENLPYKVNGVNQSSSLILFNCLSIVSWIPNNSEQMKIADNYFGGVVTDFETDLDFKQRWLFVNVPHDRFRYFRCSSLSINGNFSQNVKNVLESYFRRGIRIWYDTTSFLKTFDQVMDD